MLEIITRSMPLFKTSLDMIFHEDIFSVRERMEKQGLEVPSNEDIVLAISKVDGILKKAKFDDSGVSLKSVSTKKQREYRELEDEPDYWQQILAVQKGSSQRSCVIASMTLRGSLEFYACDLLVSSENLNNGNFRKQFGNCLLQDSCVIYFEVTNITLLGQSRLISLLEGCKELFDSRVILVMYSESSMPRTLANFSQVTLELITNNHNPSKKPKLGKNITPLKTSESRLDLEEEVINARGVIARLEAERATDSESLGRLTSENVQLKLDLDACRNELAVTLERAKDYKEALNLKETELATALEQLKEKVGSSFDQNSSVIKMGEATGFHEDGGNGSIVKDKATFEKLKLRLNQIQENFVDSSPMEIVRRTLVDFQFNVSFGGKILAKDDFTCTVKIITIERDLLCYINTEWIGKGRSKKLAKYDAFKNLLSDMKV